MLDLTVATDVPDEVHVALHTVTIAMLALLLRLLDRMHK